jgi:hypothetical protein
MTVPLPTPREAMAQAVERAKVGDYEGGHVWTAIARELREGAQRGHELPVPRIEPDHGGADLLVEPTYGRTHGGEPAYHEGGIVVPVPEPAYRRAETTVMERVSDETTPAYEAAGESLGETKAIPLRIAHPQEDDRGPNSMCINCYKPVIWIKGRGWVHDVPSHSASCETASRDDG